MASTSTPLLMKSPSVLKTNTVHLLCTSLLIVLLAGGLLRAFGHAFLMLQAPRLPLLLELLPSHHQKITKWEVTTSFPVQWAPMQMQAQGSVFSLRAQNNGISQLSPLRIVTQATTRLKERPSVVQSLLASASLALEILQSVRQASSVLQAVHHVQTVQMGAGLNKELLFVYRVLLGTPAKTRTPSLSASKASTLCKTSSLAKRVHLDSSATLAQTRLLLSSSPVLKDISVQCLVQL